jgi:uncharacterized membrane protein (UPF0127 family)
MEKIMGTEKLGLRKKTIKKKFFRFGMVCLGLLLLSGITKIIIRNNHSRDIEFDRSLTIGATRLEVALAVDPKEKWRGLSGIKHLNSDQGMLFDHQGKTDYYRYEMRGMNINLDFIFIKNFRVVGLKKNVSKNFQGTVVGEEPYDMVLEVNAGWTEKHNIKVGDQIKIE